ncbi:MAG TPA: hypothetical protein VK960_01400 [Acidimicrobiia bacterium]|nr:hypothetical protein [Acidimicrobiia bacterium]
MRTTSVSLHNVDRRLVLADRPGMRGWYNDLLADPTLTIHLEPLGVDAEVPGRAMPVTEWQERRRLMEQVMVKGFGFAPDRASRELDFWVTRSPLVRVEADWPGWVDA